MIVSIAIIIPALIGLSFLVGLILLIKSSLSKNKSTAHGAKITLALILGLILAVFAFSSIRLFLEDRNISKQVENRGFEIYDLPDQLNYIDTEALRSTTGGTIQYVNLQLNSPEGEIDVRQAGFDNVIHDLFRPQDFCDYDQLSNYIFATGALDKYTKTTKPCLLIYQANNRSLYKPLNNERAKHSYIGVIDNTILLLEPRTGTGQFKGSSQALENYITDFIKRSIVVNEDRLKI